MAVAIVHAWLRPILVEERRQIGKLRERLLEFENEILPCHLEYSCVRIQCPLEYSCLHNACPMCSEIVDYMQMLQEDIKEIQQRSSGAVALGTVSNM